jgi:hypothetical protein
MTVDQSGPADSYGERSLKRAWNFSEISRQQTWGSLQFRLWAIDGLVIGGQRQPLSVVSLPPQPIDATQALNLSAGVSNCKVSRGRSLS